MDKPIRNVRFKQLMDDRFGGKNRDIAAAIGISDDLVSRYATGSKTIGERMKKRIEETLKLPDDWLDGNDDKLTLTVENKDLWIMFNHLIHLPDEEIDRFRQIYELTLGVEFEKLDQLGRKQEIEERRKEDDRRKKDDQIRRDLDLERRQADAERRKVDEERRRDDIERRKADAERRRHDYERKMDDAERLKMDGACRNDRL